MMTRLRTLFVLALICAASAIAQYPEITIRQMQEVPLDSLLLADTLQLTNPARWTLQASPYYRDTVTIVAQCVAPAKVLTFTQRGFTLLLIDTTANWAPWGAVLVRVGSSSDTSQAILDGLFNVESGDIIKMTGRVDEFPAGLMTSVTQFVPIPGVPIEIISSGASPTYVPKTIADFYTGIFPGGKVQYSTGEPYEGLPVELATPLTVDTRVNTLRGTFSMVDGSGNQMSEYDASKYFTLAGGTTDHSGPDSTWLMEYPVAGTVVNTMKGFITTVSGSENPRGYRIAPIYYGDVGLGVVLPSLFGHNRNPIVVPPDSAPRVSVFAAQLLGGLPIDSVQVVYSIDNAPFVSLNMVQDVGDMYTATLPMSPENSFVRYFIRATDIQDSAAILASSAFGGAASDTSLGFFFYNVLNRPLTVHDVQYTPFLNGRTPYLGATVSVSGIVTADTAHLHVSPLSNNGATAWFLQNGNQPWEGLWFVPTVADSLYFLRNGDSVTVTGTVTEQFDVTQLVGASAVVHTSNRPEPAPVVSTTGTFGIGVGNGTPSAEQYEGMLVQFNNARVSALYPEFNDRREFEIDDGTGPVRVLREGTHTFSNDTLDSPSQFTILHLNDVISGIRGIIYYSFNKYKFVPRTNADFGTITGVEIEYTPQIPGTFSLAQNYPNPFNPSTVISYTLPSAGRTTLRIYNILGQEVRTLVDDYQLTGTYDVRFDASALSTGVYFYALQSAGKRDVKKMLLLK